MLKMKYLIISSILIMVGINSIAQSHYEAGIDSLSLRLYNEERWEDLFQLVENAQNKEIEFYYLDLRGALAAFHTQRYFKASDYFKQAQNYKRGNDYIREIQYLSALYAQMPLRTLKAYEALSDEAQTRYSAPKYKAIEYVGLLGGFNLNSDYNQMSAFESEGVYSDRILFNKLNYTDLYSGHHISPRWQIHQTLERLDIQKVQDTYTLPPNTNLMEHQQLDITTKQWSYNMNIWFNINDKIQFYPFFTLLSYSTNYLHIKYNETNLTYTSTPTTINENQTLLGLGFNFRQAKSNIDLSASYLNTDRGNIIQSKAEIKLFPIEGKKHYISVGWNSINRNNSIESYFNHHVFDFDLGINIKKTWLNLSYSTGNHHFLRDHYGATVYNTYENIHSIAGLNINLPIYANLWLTANYKYINYSSKSYYANTTVGLYNTSFTHNNHSISGGLTWYF